MFRTIAAAALLAAAPALIGVAAPAQADSGSAGHLVVRGAQIPAGSPASMALVGCGSIYSSVAVQASSTGSAKDSLTPFISLGPGKAPAGRRSLGYDLPGGSAIGPVFPRTSMLQTKYAQASFYAPAGARGVAYAGYQSPEDAGTKRLWIGRAQLTASNSWTAINAVDLTYTWTQYSMRTKKQVASSTQAPATVADFAAAHGGDGAGYYTLGFGCDGQRFNTDAWRVGSAGEQSSYDFEGLRTSTSIRASATTVTSGDRVSLTGGLTKGNGSALAAGTLRLEQKSSQTSGWEPVALPVTPGTPITVNPTVNTQYRFVFVDRPVAEGSTSPAIRVRVTRPKPSSVPPQDDQGGQDGQDDTAGQGDDRGADQPDADGPSPEASDPASPSAQDPTPSGPSGSPAASDQPSTTGSPSPSAQPSDAASAEPTPATEPLNPEFLPPAA